MGHVSVSIVPCAITYGDVKLPAIFGDQMVIQQKANCVWGWADAGEKVEVKGSWMWFGTSVKADKTGCGGSKSTPGRRRKPLTLTIKGNNTIT